VLKRLQRLNVFKERHMPELPEVESTVMYLRERAEGSTILDAHISWPRTVATHNPASFRRKVTGFTIDKVFRRGKFIGIESKRSPDKFIFIHLRMSGSLDVVRADSPAAAHDRVILTLENGKSIRFNDTRKFGRLYLCNDESDVVGKLGVEPLDSSFSPELLYELLQRRSTRIKPLLLDQTVIAGLGNIYVDESLWKAQIHPLTLAKRISKERCVMLHRAITQTLREAVSLLGTDFGDGVVDGGMYSPVVYAREDTPCQRCGTTIKKTTVGQRGTHFCPSCQRRVAPRSSPAT
jgi:formamidopyrimidine-DNA glycosylase